MGRLNDENCGKKLIEMILESIVENAKNDDDENSSGAVCKISDFGTSRDVDITTTLSMTHSITMTSNIGTPLYMTPELLNGTGRYSTSADVYSYGIVLAGLWNQTIPYSEFVYASFGDGCNFSYEL